MPLIKDIKTKIVLFLMAFIVYANTLGHDFAWDDSIVITENPRVQKGFSGLADLFVKYNSDYKADKYGYRPIVLCSFAIEYGIFNGSAKAMHLMNVIYFGLLCMVLFSVLRKIFYRYSEFVPFLICLLFSAHPVHSEVVANIKSRDEIFAFLFSLLSLGQFIRFHQSKKISSLIYSCTFFLLAFLSKESAFTFLFIIPLTLLYLEKGKNIKKIAVSSLPIIGLLALSFIIIKLYTETDSGKSASAGAGIFHESGIMGNSFFYTAALGTKLANACTVLFVYLKNFFYPAHLVYFYGYNQIPVASWSEPLVIFSLVLHLGLLAFAILRFKKNAEISYAILFYFISISFYTHIVKTLADTMADRFFFVPSLGVCMLLIFAFEKLLKTDFSAIKINKVFSGNNNLHPAFKYGFIIIISLLSLRTFYRNKNWKNDESLITHDMPYLENCARAHNYYADILKKKLKDNFDVNTEQQMIAHYRKACEITNESYYAWLGLGTYFFDTGKTDEGIEVLDAMLKIFPEQADPNYYYGACLLKKGNAKKAVLYLEKSLRLAPEVSSTYYQLSLSYSASGEFKKAENTALTAKRKFGESAMVYDALGTLYFEKNDLEQSTKYTLEMLRLGENPQAVYGKIIGRYQLKKMNDKAALYYNEAVAKGIFRKQ